MSYQDDRSNQIQGEINRLNNIKRALREREKSLNARQQYLDNPQAFPVNNIKGLRNSLLGNLPNFMMPGNVGGINEVTWPFYFQVNIDMGDDPTVSQHNFSITKNFFQVDQEAAFLLQSVGRSHSTNAAGQSATFSAPLQIELIDRQSSRRFSDKPFPLQMVGLDSIPSVFPTPMYIQPNAFLDVIVNGIPELEQHYNGSGLFQLSFFGYRIRTEDAGKVLSTIFGSAVS
jgi:hypothetical protein